jgi:hypothetical protein
MRRDPQVSYSTPDPNFPGVSPADRTVAELGKGCDDAVFRYIAETDHPRRVHHLAFELLWCAANSGHLADVDPSDQDLVRRVLNDIEERLSRVLKQYRKVFSHVDIEINAWGRR